MSWLSPLWSYAEITFRDSLSRGMHEDIVVRLDGARPPLTVFSQINPSWTNSEIGPFILGIQNEERKVQIFYTTPAATLM